MSEALGPRDGEIYQRHARLVTYQRVPRREDCRLIACLPEEESGDHAASPFLAGKASRQSFYYIAALQDAMSLARHCKTHRLHH